MTPSSASSDDQCQHADVCYGEWKQVPGFKGSLLASSEGFVWQREVRFNNWMMPRLGNLNGYGYRKIKRARKTHNVHVLVCTAFHGPMPFPGCTVDHINRKKADNRACNLQWAKKSEQCVNRKKAVKRRDSKPIWVWKLCEGRESAVLYENAGDASSACVGAHAANLRKVALGSYGQTAGYGAEFQRVEPEIEGEVFRRTGTIEVSQFGRMRRFGAVYTPRPLENQIYATYDNNLFHRLVALAWPDIVGKRPDDPTYTVDHINRDCTDNRASNLRWASKAAQRANQRR